LAKIEVLIGGDLQWVFNRNSRSLAKLVFGDPGAIGASLGELGTVPPRQRAHFCLEALTR
jgi:hypothetical protein